MHQPLDILEALRTPYRIDIVQPVYFVLEQLADLEKFCSGELLSEVNRAMALGLRTPRFEAAEPVTNS